MVDCAEVREPSLCPVKVYKLETWYYKPYVLETLFQPLGEETP